MADERLKSAIEQYIDRLGKSERDISVIQKENEMQARVFIKFEETVEKLQVLTESMHRLISIHDERIRVQEKTIDAIRSEMNNEIKDLESRLSQKLEDTEKRIMNRLNENKEFFDNVKEEIQAIKDNEVKKKESFAEKWSAVTAKIESWKYFVIGGLLVASFLLGKGNILNSIMGIFKNM
jgi:hypothetical protein